MARQRFGGNKLRIGRGVVDPSGVHVLSLSATFQSEIAGSSRDKPVKKTYSTQFRRSFFDWTTAACLACALALLAAPGCRNETRLSDPEKARLIKVKRKEALDALAKFKASGEEDLKALQRYVELHRQTTELAPATCPNCWAEYGQALSTWGWFYWQRHHMVLEDLEQARPEEKAGLEAEAERYREEYQKHFHEANLAYETHFRDRSSNFVHPYSYERVMRHYEVLGDFDRALYYQQKFMDGYPEMNAINRKKLEDLRRLYKQELQKQKERGIDEEGRDTRAAPQKPSTRKGPSSSTRSAARAEE